MKKFLSNLWEYFKFPWLYWYYEFKYWKNKKKMGTRDPFIYENLDDEK